MVVDKRDSLILLAAAGAALVLFGAVLPRGAWAGSTDELGAIEMTPPETVAVANTKAPAQSPDSLPPITKMPEIKQFVKAAYPTDLQKQGVEGTVVMDLVVSDSGTVDSVGIVSGLNPALDSAASAAAHRFTFSPALSDTTRVPVILRYEYRFSLQEVVEKVTEYVNLSGKLLERGTRKPIPDAMLVVRFVDTLADTGLGVPFSTYLKRIGGFKGQYLEEDRLVTVTDSMGRFQFRSLPVGPIEVTAPVPEYEQLVDNRQVLRGEAQTVEYYLQRVNYNDYEVVVYDKAEKKEVSSQQLTLSEIKKIPGVGGDAVKVVQALPGVARPTFGTAQIVVRGAPTDNSKFLLDGIEIPQGMLFHFGGVTSTYNAEALKSIDFYPGGMGTRYGDVLGGVVELTGREAKMDRLHVSTGADFVDGALYAEGPIGDKVGMIGEVRRSFIGDILGWVVSQNTSAAMLTVAPFYWDYLVRTDWNINKDQHAFLTLWGVKDATELVSSQVRGGSSDIDKATNAMKIGTFFHLGILGHNWTINDAWTNTFRYSFGYVEADVSAFGYWKSNTNYLQNYLRDQLTYSHSKKFKLNIGADVELEPINESVTTSMGNNEISTAAVKNDWYGDVGAYVNCEWRPWEKLLIVPGLRYDYFPELKSGTALPEFWDYHFDNTTGWSGQPSARLMLRYDFVKHMALKFAVGNYSQTPQPIVQSINPLWGNPNLSAMHAAQYVLGYEYQLTDLISADLEGYINRQWDVAEQVTAFPPYDDHGKLRMEGIELMLRHDQGGPFFGWIAYSLAHAEYYDYKVNDWVNTSKDQTHNLILIAYTALPKNWGVGLRLQYTTGDPTTPIVGSIYDENTATYNIVNGPPNSTRLPPTFQIDLRIERRFVFRKWTITGYVGFVNINYFINQSPQAVVPNFSYPYNAQTGTAYQTIVPQYSLPTIGLKAEF